MRTNKIQELAHSVNHYLKNVCDGNSKLTYIHFTSQDIEKFTIWSIFKRFETSSSANYKKLTSYPAKVMSLKVKKKINKKNRREKSTDEIWKKWAGKTKFKTRKKKEKKVAKSSKHLAESTKHLAGSSKYLAEFSKHVTTWQWKKKN